MYYSSGNYEAFATPKKPEGIDNKSAYVVGTGLAGLAAACFLIRDAQMPGEHITLFEHLPVAGGSCDGIYDATKGFIMRGGREMDNHFECMWDLFKSIPSIVNPGETVFSEYYYLNKEDPNFSLCRVTEKQGQDAHTDRKYGLTPGAATQLLKLFMATNKSLEDKKIDDVFDDEFYATNFWTYWQTMFAFEKWHSALEMKLYLQRYIHHIDGLPDLSALRFTRYNQYESMILPMCKYITDHGGKVLFDTTVTNIVCDCTEDKKVAKKIEYTQGGVEKVIELTENDLVICTNGCQGDARSRTAKARPSRCGRSSPRRIRRSAIPRSSSRTSRRPAGSPGPSTRPTSRSSTPSRRSASATRCPARSLPAASSPAAIRAGSSAGPSTVRASSRSSRRITA